MTSKLCWVSQKITKLLWPFLHYQPLPCPPYLMWDNRPNKVTAQHTNWTFEAVKRPNEGNCYPLSRLSDTDSVIGTTSSKTAWLLQQLKHKNITRTCDFRDIRWKMVLVTLQKPWRITHFWIFRFTCDVTEFSLSLSDPTWFICDHDYLTPNVRFPCWRLRSRALEFLVKNSWKSL